MLVALLYRTHRWFDPFGVRFSTTHRGRSSPSVGTPPIPHSEIEIVSITVEGTLNIKRIKGANGPFCVGDLLTDIGEFRVKDPILDQFEEGSYTGRYIIQRIFPWSYASNGRLVLEIRARLADLHVQSGTERSLPEAPMEPDPADEAVAQTARPGAGNGDLEGSGAPERGQEGGAPPVSPTTGSDESPDLELFGDELHGLVAARQPVKLDPTIDDRRRFREQRNRLKSGLQYGFVPEEQVWYPEESDRYRAYLAAKADAS
ncbi:hypothetical protein CDA09_14205 [Azoarcus sp. DN11]|nr:hypothetical protein CDA09_14205 [Azoarcus sp. DN11]